MTFLPKISNLSVEHLPTNPVTPNRDATAEIPSAQQAISSSTVHATFKLRPSAKQNTLESERENMNLHTSKMKHKKTFPHTFSKLSKILENDPTPVTTPEEGDQRLLTSISFDPSSSPATSSTHPQTLPVKKQISGEEVAKFREEQESLVKLTQALKDPNDKDYISSLLSFGKLISKLTKQTPTNQ